MGSAPADHDDLALGRCRFDAPADGGLGPVVVALEPARRTPPADRLGPRAVSGVPTPTDAPARQEGPRRLEQLDGVGGASLAAAMRNATPGPARGRSEGRADAR